MAHLRIAAGCLLQRQDRMLWQGCPNAGISGEPSVGLCLNLWMTFRSLMALNRFSVAVQVQSNAIHIGSVVVLLGLGANRSPSGDGRVAPYQGWLGMCISFWLGSSWGLQGFIYEGRVCISCLPSNWKWPYIYFFYIYTKKNKCH